MTDQESGDGARRLFAEAARTDKPDLATLCLLLGELVEPGRGAVDREEAERAVDEGQIELDRLTGELPFAAHRRPVDWAGTLRALLGERLGFHGDRDDYERLESSQLGKVLRRRRGLPILLSVVWIEVARRAGAPVHGVALPGHFVVGFGEPDGEHVLVDPFAGGRLMSEQEAELLVAGATGRPLSRAMLQPAQPLEIVSRVLNNIRSWAAQRPEHTDVALAAVELALLLPHHPARLRYERARLLVERGDFVAGARGLEEYAALVAAMEPQAAETAHREARAARARLN
ncbi:transglutaminase-like domain-containing protein [Streptomyces alkaliterrae]|uniref:Tetratricopeptide repeat protein n=1 Tax=Streptomyces alkaliterrae TaxID=2213162 RepID=A0A5P0YNJ5_9ACTN|nr:transglutaminase-like domain-containing protein [Streptomyces alkaliterrae]MBB1254550.1 tetratricopeptide repeat protein [Streptomyces alkaliterrae]MBB1258167.1 tetratricopeptide repeat protein [Streptomyces alkaliterrae]MQS01923.1 tetratricopeptide repeat protein [Streptomyces alkaliterrae]